MLSEVFDKLSLFHDFTQEERAILSPYFLEYFLHLGSVLFEQGDPVEYLYIVVEGEVIIRFKPEDGPALIVARIHPEGLVGWSAAIGSPKYTSSAVCTSDCQFLRIRSSDLQRLCEHYPDLGNTLLKKMADVVADRWRNAHPQIMDLLHLGANLPL